MRHPIHADLFALTLLLSLACGSGGDAAGEPSPAQAPAAEATETEAPAPRPCEPRFRCPVAGGKEILVCASEQGLQYRFGPPGAPELVYPAQGPGRSFTHEDRSISEPTSEWSAIAEALE